MGKRRSGVATQVVNVPVVQLHRCCSCMSGWLFGPCTQVHGPGSPTIRVGKGWRGRRELAPRCSATQLGAFRNEPGQTRRCLQLFVPHTHHTPHTTHTIHTTQNTHHTHHTHHAHHTHHTHHTHHSHTPQYHNAVTQHSHTAQSHNTVPQHRHTTQTHTTQTQITQTPHTPHTTHTHTTQSVAILAQEQYRLELALQQCSLRVQSLRCLVSEWCWVCAMRFLLFLLVFGEGTVSASFTKFEGLGKYLGNVPILGKWSFVSALESSSLLKPSPPPSFGDDASATPSLWVKLPAGWEMFIAEYGDLDEFGLVLFSVDTVSESSAISGIETDSKGYSSVNFDTLVLETCYGVGFFCIAEAAAATCHAFPNSPFAAVATAAVLHETTLDGKTEGKRIFKALFLLVCYLCAPQVACAGHSAAACFYTALFFESFAAAAKAGAFLLLGLLLISFCKPIVILQVVVDTRFGLIWIVTVDCAELFVNSFFCGPGTPVVGSLVAAVCRLVLGLRWEEVTHCASLVLRSFLASSTMWACSGTSGWGRARAVLRWHCAVVLAGPPVIWPR